MKYADIELTRGERVKGVSAFDFLYSYGGDSYYHPAFCPLCGERVYFINGDIQEPHFRHRRGSVKAKTCENYSANTSSYQEMVASYNRDKDKVHLAIEKTGISFQLYLRFPPLTREQVGLTKDSKQQRSNATVSVDAVVENHYTKHLASFFVSEVKPDETYYLPIGRVYIKYLFQYSIPGLRDTWGSKTTGYYENGTFFHMYSGKCQRVSENGNVIVGTDYYYLQQNARDEFKNKPFLKVKGTYEILTSVETSWKIYCVEFTTFSDEAKTFAEKSHVTLVEKPQEYIPLWSPMIQQDTFDYGEKETRHILTQPSKIFYTIDFPIDEGYVEIGRNVNPSEFPLVDANVVETIYTVDSAYQYPKYQQPEISVCWNGKTLNPIGDTVLPLKTKERDLSISTEIKCDVIHVRGNNILDSWSDKESVPAILNIKNNDKVLIYHGQDCIASLSIQRKSTSENREENDVSDSRIYSFLKRQDDILVQFPLRLKYILPKFAKYPKTFEYLKMMMKEGKIGKNAEEYLFTQYKKGDV